MLATKRIYILAGPNGAGKTTFAREFLTKEGDCTVFINADLIADGLSPFAPARAAIRAGRIILELIADAVRRGDTFAFETTLAGRNYARAIAQAMTPSSSITETTHDEASRIGTSSC